MPQWEWVGDPGRCHSSLPAHAVPCRTVGIPPRKGESRAEVICDLELWEKWEGEIWVFCPQEGNRRSRCTVQSCARFATSRGYCPGKVLLRERDEFSQPLGWVSPWREPADLLQRCIWNYSLIYIMWTLCHRAVQTYPKPTQSIEESTELQTLILTPACPFKITFPLHLWKEASLLSCSDFVTHKIGSLLLKFSCYQECTLSLTRQDNYPKISPFCWYAGVLQAGGHREVTLLLCTKSCVAYDAQERISPLEDWHCDGQMTS